MGLHGSAWVCMQCIAPHSDACGTRTRNPRIDGPALFHRAHAPEGTVVPESGWPESNRRPRRPERRALPACATARKSSGGRCRTPASWFRARCAPGYTTPEGCVPGGSNSDPRGKGPPGYRRDARGGSPARSNERRRLSTGHRVDAEGGVRHQRVEVIGGGRTPARVRTERIELSWTRSAGF